MPFSISASACESPAKRKENSADYRRSFPSLRAFAARRTERSPERSACRVCGLRKFRGRRPRGEPGGRATEGAGGRYWRTAGTDARLSLPLTNARETSSAVIGSGLLRTSEKLYDGFRRSRRRRIYSSTTNSRYRARRRATASAPSTGRDSLGSSRSLSRPTVSARDALHMMVYAMRLDNGRDAYWRERLFTEHGQEAEAAHHRMWQVVDQQPTSTP